jgi:hypothetical protein
MSKQTERLRKEGKEMLWKYIYPENTKPSHCPSQYTWQAEISCTYSTVIVSGYGMASFME